jgi:hypothetical protein
MPRKHILALLRGGDKRSIGRANQVAAMVSADRRLFAELIEGLWADDPLIRMRTADAAEKVTRSNPELLAPFQKELLGLLKETTQQELRWHVAAMIPRLPLNPQQRRLVASVLSEYLEDHSSIVKTFALQALADLAEDDSDLRSKVLETLRQAVRNGTPAMKARARKLLLRLERA